MYRKEICGNNTLLRNGKGLKTNGIFIKDAIPAPLRETLDVRVPDVRK